MNRSIVCGIDDARAGHAAVEVAATLARSLDCELVLAHVVDDPPTFPYRDARLRELERRRVIEAGTPLLERIAAGLPGLAPRTKVLLGAAVERLTDLCRDEDAELLVVGSRGRGPLASALLGSVSRSLASASECPVVVVPAQVAGERFLENGRIVCGVDGSVGSVRALRVALGLAERTGRELLALYVDEYGAWDDASLDGDGDGLQVYAGEPVDALARRAADDRGSLIVVGSRGLGPVRSAVLGSVSNALVAAASVPVLVVPPTARLPRLAEEVGDHQVERALRTARRWTRDRAQVLALDAHGVP